MYKSFKFKYLIVVVGFVLLFVFVQVGDVDKMVVIKELLMMMNVDVVIKGQGEVLVNGVKQEVLLVLEQVLVENKILNDKQK